MRELTLQDFTKILNKQENKALQIRDKFAKMEDGTIFISERGDTATKVSEDRWVMHSPGVHPDGSWATDYGMARTIMNNVGVWTVM